MMNDAKKSDSKYGEFVARMLAAEAAEIAWAAGYNAKFATPVASQLEATVRPSK